MRRLLREPLLHFLVLGALLFVLYGWLNRGRSDAADEIVVTRGQLQSMTAQFTRVWQRPPTPDELNGLVESWLREEIFYRAGLAQGMDRGDPVVRRRIAQKLEFVADGQTPVPPSDAQLQAWLDAHSDKYRVEVRYTMRQIYFDPARRGERLDADLAAAQRALAGGRPAAGDSTLLPQALDSAAASEVVRVFGSDFAQALKTLPVGGWSGPVRSGFGLHLVDLRARDDGRAATLDEVRAAVQRDWLHARTEELKAAYYNKLRANYTVRIEGTEPVATRAGKPGAMTTP